MDLKGIRAILLAFSRAFASIRHLPSFSMLTLLGDCLPALPFGLQMILSDGSPNKRFKIVKSALFEGDELWESSWKEAVGEATIKKRMHPEGDIKFILYSSWFCPFAQRAWIAAEESGVNYRWVEIDPYYVDLNNPGGYTQNAKTLEEKRQDCPAFIEASPRGLVPALQQDDNEKGPVFLWESLPVTEYIDAVFGGGKLLNRSDPYSVARQQIWCGHCTDRIQRELLSSFDGPGQGDPGEVCDSII